MDSQGDTQSPSVSRATIVAMVVGLVVLGLAFGTIAVTDVSSAGSLLYWNLLVILVAAASLANSRYHAGLKLTDFRTILPMLLHWLAVLVVIHLLFLLVSTGRMANADVGLTCAFILTLGTVLDGIRGNWRMIVLGLALGLLTIGMAIVEQYVWVLLIVALLAIAMLLIGARLTGHRKGDA
ncbi:MULTISPECIES: hypothetical protein [unclassified Meridianimarinicoccus]|uniref:hypothetical protein n=1 Tax=unclassified Meridianimarinicoccus TaxID=2923344 RepID=UPI001866A504|nr:hypothetical protein [Fluviibacterium sp. MJW13]